VPTYQYACTACGSQLEVVQRFSDDPLTECPECAGRLRKIFSAVGVVFKGSGFYRNDSRSEGKAAANGSSEKKSEEKSGDASSDGATQTTGDTATEKKADASSSSTSGGSSSGESSSGGSSSGGSTSTSEKVA